MLQELKEILKDSQDERDIAFSQLINSVSSWSLSEESLLWVEKILVEILNKLHPKPQNILILRQKVWENNFGVPTLDFQLLNKKIIDNLIENLSHKNPYNLMEQGFLFYLSSLGKSIEVKDLYSQYDMPEADSTGSFIPTVNKQGYMTTKTIDLFSKQFVECAEKSKTSGGRVLEIGAAYGIATLSALDRGATVVCNDLEAIHLAVVVKEHMKMERGHLLPVAGSFPEELVFNDNEFDAILISRVLHFFDGDELVNALKKARQWLKIGGNLFVINETPYLSNWKSFHDDYNQKKLDGEKWPGLIKDTKKYEQNRSLSLPPLVHWLDEDTLRQALYEAGFIDDEIQISYINREGQFPPDMLMKEEQRESVGCNVMKLR